MYVGSSFPYNLLGNLRLEPTRAAIQPDIIISVALFPGLYLYITYYYLKLINQQHRPFYFIFSEFCLSDTHNPRYTCALWEQTQTNLAYPLKFFVLSFFPVF